MNISLLKKSIFFCFISASLLAQTDTINNNKPATIPDSYFKFNYDNDFFSATDRYYTQGIYMELVMPFVKKSPVSKLLIPINKNALNYYGLNVEQDVFTPRSIRHSTIYYGERPYAAVFFVSHFLTSIDAEKKRRLTTSLDLGIIGSDAMGEQEQKGIHHALKNIQPLGWEFQIARDYVINYDAQFEQGLFVRKGFECIGSLKTRVGTLYDDIGAGLLLRSGWMQSYFKNLGLSSSKNKIKKFQCYVFSKGELKTVAYNATLQGGIFNKNSVYTLSANDIERVVATAYVGIVLAYKRFSVEYTKAYISPEFKGGLPHGWGHCSITACF